MKNLILLIALTLSLFATSCGKEDDPNPGKEQEQTDEQKIQRRWWVSRSTITKYSPAHLKLSVNTFNFRDTVNTYSEYLPNMVYNSSNRGTLQSGTYSLINKQLTITVTGQNPLLYSARLDSLSTSRMVSRDTLPDQNGNYLVRILTHKAK